MNYNEMSLILKDSLDLKLEPVAVTYTNDIEDHGLHKKIQICNALKEAFNGQSYVLDLEASICPGGTWHCGLDKPPAGDKKRRIQRFLTKGEKLFHSITAFERSQKLNSQPPTGLADNIIITPLADAKIRPDLIIFMVKPDNGCRLLHLDSYWDGIPPRVEPTGAMCHSIITYSIMSGRTNLSLGDWTARKHHNFPGEYLFVTIPYERIENLIKAIPLCTAGKADVVFFEDL